jgi:hypothetical protein
MADSGTAALTALFGVIVFVVGQSAQRFVLKPVQDQRKVIGDIAHAVLMYGNVNSVSEVQARGMPVSWPANPDQVVRDVRDLAARLQASLYVIPAYQALAWLRLVPSRARILRAIQGLTGWSNSVYSGGAMAAQDIVVEALGIIRNA